MFDTKFVIVVRDDLAAWQKLNVTAFLSTGVAAAKPDLIGEPYRDAAGHVYHAMSVQPIIVLSADQDTIARIHQRALQRGVAASLYIEEMFATGHDAANREVFGKFTPDDAKVVGLAFHTDRKVADKISKGAKMHT
ncbi:DUF2000 family protein [Labrenzia sp. VG12]|uniref:DUF2000 family protein n=1 Tax=Labrenzia sp. VG12 TaxID=2021862 RepID=UPI000B8BF1A9|nr:DUF2000 family protein [Labrenzia sp. VG12]ASP32170.1 hypothetical protein CHH27_02045 [Labrenzia sp. VG12]